MTKAEKAELERLREKVTEMVEALEEITELSCKRQWPVTEQINAVAQQALNSYRGIA